MFLRIHDDAEAEASMIRAQRTQHTVPHFALYFADAPISGLFSFAEKIRITKRRNGTFQPARFSEPDSMAFVLNENIAFCEVLR